MSKRPHYLALVAVLLVTLAVLNLPDRHSASLKSLWGTSFLPLFGLARSAGDLASAVRYSVLPRSLLNRQLTSLQKENDQLKLSLSQLETVRLENQRLRQSLQWQAQPASRARLARVIAHDPANWWRSILIDLGQRDGIQVDQTVVSTAGLVGRITEVALTRSRVLLIGDPNCRFSAMVERTRDKGIISPDESSFDRQVVNLTYLPTSATLQPGSDVITSGDGGVFPKGIAVGRLIDVQTNSFGLYLEARVRLAANLNHLEEVWVLSL